MSNMHMAVQKPPASQAPQVTPKPNPNPDKRPKLEEMLREANAQSALNRLSKGGKCR
jgi:hypothetical protein